MKICAIICEYNPFHNGHLYQLQEAKRLSGADAVLCIMSGNFVQRGEGSILDKFTRAKHAVIAGADAVIELPTVFATSNAELFAKGAIKLLSSLPDVTTLCFGAENADKNAFWNAARLMSDEPQEISRRIKELLGEGFGYAKARATAWAGKIPDELLSFPNNILGVEYAKAILQSKSNINLLPIARIGAGYNDGCLQGEYSSATAIRAAISAKESYAGALPEFVIKDLPKSIDDGLDRLEKYAILRTPACRLARVLDCAEGLENAFKKAAILPERLENSLTSPRYTAARIRRIALQNLLGIEERLVRDSLSSPLYLRVLAIKKARKDLLSALAESNFPLLVRPRDEEKLQDEAKECFEVDCFAEKVYSLLSPKAPTVIDIFL